MTWMGFDGQKNADAGQHSKIADVQAMTTEPTELERRVAKAITEELFGQHRADEYPLMRISGTTMFDLARAAIRECFRG